MTRHDGLPGSIVTEETRIDVVSLAAQLLRNAYRGIEEAHHLLYPEASALVASGDVDALRQLAGRLPTAPADLEILNLRRDLEQMAELLERSHLV